MPVPQAADTPLFDPTPETDTVQRPCDRLTKCLGIAAALASAGVITVCGAVYAMDFPPVVPSPSLRMKITLGGAALGAGLAVLAGCLSHCHCQRLKKFEPGA